MIASRMLPLVRFIRNSGNTKTGNIPVTSTQSSSCAPSCPFLVDGKAKCYGGSHWSAKHWSDLDDTTEPGGSIFLWFDFVAEVARLPASTLWRHDEVGDLPHNAGEIDEVAVAALVHANRRKFGFTYTHHELTEHNLRIIKECNLRGFTVNVSCNTAKDAVAIMREHSVPTVCILPKDAPNSQRVDGTQVVACPHEKNKKKIQCSNCRLCAIPDRAYVIGFRPHSTLAAVAERIANGGAA